MQTAATYERESALLTVKRLQTAGFTAYWAGGCVRDMLLGIQPKDYDVATSATPEQVMKCFPGSLATGRSFGVVRVPVADHSIEVATFRRDMQYLDGRRPEAVVFSDPQTDALRRDFTINAMFHDPVSGETHDLVGGRRDLQTRIIRCVGDASERLREDHLRLLRAARFAATLEFSIEPLTAEAIRRHAGLLARISAERVRIELVRLLTESPRAGQAIVLLQDLELLPVIVPEISAMRGVPQPPEYHPEGDVFTHTVLMLDMMETVDPCLAIAVLLHDVGKPPTLEDDGRGPRFPGHAPRGAEIADGIMKRLRFAARDIETVTTSIRNHMRFKDVPSMKLSTLRRMVGAPGFPLELELHRLDCLASHGKLETYHELLEARRTMENTEPLPPAWVNGHDVMALGVPRGPAVGRWLRAAYDAQLEGLFDNHAALLDWLRGQIGRQDS